MDKIQAVMVIRLYILMHGQQRGWNKHIVGVIHIEFRFRCGNRQMSLKMNNSWKQIKRTVSVTEIQKISRKSHPETRRKIVNGFIRERNRKPMVKNEIGKTVVKNEIGNHLNRVNFFNITLLERNNKHHFELHNPQYDMQ